MPANNEGIERYFQGCPHFKATIQTYVDSCFLFLYNILYLLSRTVKRKQNLEMIHWRTIMSFETVV